MITAADIAEETEQKSFIPMIKQVEENLGVTLKEKRILAEAARFKSSV